MVLDEYERYLEASEGRDTWIDGEDKTMMKTSDEENIEKRNVRFSGGNRSTEEGSGGLPAQFLSSWR